LIILSASVSAGRWLASDGSQGDCQNIAVENVADVVTSMDRLPTMWLGAQSGRFVFLSLLTQHILIIMLIIIIIISGLVFMVLRLSRTPG